MKKEEYEDFLNLKLENYIYNSILGSDDFSQPITNLNSNVKNVLDECIRIILENEGIIPENLIQIIDSNINNLKSHLNTINAIVEKWPNSDQDKKKSLIQEIINLRRIINDFVQVIYFQRNSTTSNISNNLLSVVALIRTYDNKGSSIIEDYKTQKTLMKDEMQILNRELTDFRTKVEKADELLNVVNQKVAEKVVYNYSEIFSKEADKHSHLRWNKVSDNSGVKKREKWSKMLGSAEIWFILSISLVCYLLYVIFHLPDWFPPFEILYGHAPLSYTSELPNVVIKITIISILIYLVTFSFKQFSIHKHLYTINKHRENALNSYKLFTETIGEDDSTSRHALMLEVAKAIYELSKTGYISDKESGNTSIIEFTKLLSNKNQ